MVFKNAWTIGLGTFSSRVLGFIRDVLIGAYLGTSDSAQAFFVAFKLPNLLRDIAAEGAASSSFIPVLAQYKTKNESEYIELVSALYSVMTSILLGISITGMLMAPILVSIIAPGFLQNPQLFHTTTILARTLFPFIFFIGIFAVNMSLLHTEGKFSTTAMGQPLFNASMICALLLFGRTGPLSAASIGVWAGGIALISMQTISILNLPFKVKITRPRMHPGIFQMFKLFLPRIFGTVIYHINILVDTILASLASIVGQGGIAAIYYANRLMQFPLALFSTSIAQAALPHLSLKHAEEIDAGLLSKDIQKAITTSAFFILPSAVFLGMCRKLVISVIFKRGAFDDYAVSITSSVLLFYAAGLVAFAGIKILVSIFYSMQDTKTPVKTATISLIVNTLLNVILMFPMKIAGLALASAIAGTVNMLLLAFHLNKRVRFLSKGLLSPLSKITGASVIMAILLMFSKISQSPPSIIILAKAIAISGAGYLLGCGIFKCRILEYIIRRGSERL